MGDCEIWEGNQSVERTDIDPKQYAAWRNSARRALTYPPVTLSGVQALEVANGFKRFINKSKLTVWACSILPEHVHFVIGRHRYKMEIAANLLKGEATRKLVEAGIHPMERYRNDRGRLPPYGERNSGSYSWIRKQQLRMQYAMLKTIQLAKG